VRTILLHACCCCYHYIKSVTKQTLTKVCIYVWWRRDCYVLLFWFGGHIHKWCVQRTTTTAHTQYQKWHAILWVIFVINTVILRQQNVLWGKKKNYKINTPHHIVYCYYYILNTYLPTYVLLYCTGGIRFGRSREKRKYVYTRLAMHAVDGHFSHHLQNTVINFYLFIYYFFLILISRTAADGIYAWKVSPFSLSLSLSLSLCIVISIIYPTISMRPPQILLWT